MNKLYFFDIDGTLSVDLFNINNHMKPCVGSYDEFMKFAVENPHTYENCKPLKCTQDFVRTIHAGGDRCFALTTDTNSFTLNAKKEMISEHYPEIEEVLFVSDDKSKITLIQQMADKYNIDVSECRLFEDTFSTIIAAQKANIRAWHITHIMLWKENNLAYKIF